MNPADAASAANVAPAADAATASGPAPITADPVPRVVAWEVTRACNLACRHCRAEAAPGCDPEELTREEAFSLLADIASFCRPTFILTGGEPLLRPDILDLARHGTELGLRVVLSTNGTTLRPETVKALREAGVKALSVSIDGAEAASHDRFRGVAGCFSAALEGMRFAREGGLPFQINTTVTRHNRQELPALLELACRVGATTWDVFLLVPTGRARAADEIPPDEYETVLGWLLEQSDRSGVSIKVTCGPMYVRLWHQRHGSSVPLTGGGKVPGGCLAGDGFAFVSRTGQVFPCGYFPVAAGSIREQPFPVIYRQSGLFRQLRDGGLLRGKCGQCEYGRLCRGCRARALAVQGDYLAEEPYCTYRPGES